MTSPDSGEMQGARPAAKRAGDASRMDALLEAYGYDVAERAAIYEFEAGMSRAEAEAKAIDDHEKEQF